MKLLSIVFGCVFVTTGFQCSSTSPASHSPGGAPSPITDLLALEQAIHNRINQVRRNNGRSPFTWNERLSGIARGHSEHMATAGFFAHETPDGRSPSDRARASGFDCRKPIDETRTRDGIGENILNAYLFHSYETSTDPEGHTTLRYLWKSKDEFATEIVDSWMKSRGHRENILRKEYHEEGIGAFVTKDYQVFITQNFC